MPIKGLTEQRRIPRLGKIHLGIKAKSARTGAEYPKAVDYFVCPPEVIEVYGEKPQKLNIMFPVEDETKFAAQWYKRYNRSFGLACKGDGEVCVRRIDIENGAEATKDSKQTTWVEGSCKGRECEHYTAKDCKEILTLQFMLPEVAGIGVYQIDTGSYHTIVGVNSCIETVRNICGRVSGIPLEMSIVPKEVNPEGGKKKTIWVLEIGYKGKLADLVKFSQNPFGRILLPPPDETTPDLLLACPEDALLEKASKPLPPVTQEEVDCMWAGEPDEPTAEEEVGQTKQSTTQPPAPAKPVIIDQKPEPTPPPADPSMQKLMALREKGCNIATILKMCRITVKRLGDLTPQQVDAVVKAAAEVGYTI